MCPWLVLLFNLIDPERMHLWICDFDKSYASRSLLGCRAATARPLSATKLLDE